MSALFGLVGVPVGVMISFAVGFWSTRRKELEAAVVAATRLIDELMIALAQPDSAA